MNLPATPLSSRPESRRWIGFFLVLALLSATAIVVPIVYNLSIQLSPEQLADARQCWRENTPANYDLEYLVKTTHAPHEEENQYLVKVRAGRVMLVASNGEILYLDPSVAAIVGPEIGALASVDVGRYGVPALFDEIEAALHRDETAERRNFATARFDPNDGHPYHYVHRVRGAKERVEWNIKLTRVGVERPMP